MNCYMDCLDTYRVEGYTGGICVFDYCTENEAAQITEHLNGGTLVFGYRTAGVVLSGGTAELNMQGITRAFLKAGITIADEVIDFASRILLLIELKNTCMSVLMEYLESHAEQMGFLMFSKQMERQFLRIGTTELGISEPLLRQYYEDCLTDLSRNQGCDARQKEIKAQYLVDFPKK